MKRVFLLLVAILIAIGSFAQRLITPSQPCIKSVGRIDKSNPECYRFDYPGIQFSMKFTGSKTIAAKLKASSQTYFEALLNGKPILDNSGKPAIFTSLRDTIIYFSENLDKSSTNEILLFKRTENLDNTPSEFMGFIADNDVKPTKASHLYKKRKMEFIGNSITCGFGTESKNIHSEFKVSTENNYLSYANILARAFDADVHITAHSGRGVVRNYGDKEKVSTKDATVPLLFEQTLDGNGAIRWDFSFKPDVVVINLGTNDYTTHPHPDEELFIATYLKLIAKVRNEYGKAMPIICIVGPMIEEPCLSNVKKVVAQQKATNNDKHIELLYLPKKMLDKTKDYGASGHPGGDGQKKMAQAAAPVISKLTGWSYSDKEMNDLKNGQDFYSRE